MDTLKKDNRNKVKRTLILIIIGIIILIAVYLYANFWGGENYPKQFHKQLDLILGNNNWSVTADTNKSSSLVKKEKDYNKYHSSGIKQGSYKTWTISFTRSNGKQSEVLLTNLPNKSKSSSRFPFSKEYVSHKEAFGMSILSAAEELAADKIKEDVLSKIFEPEEFEYGSPKLGVNGVGISVSFYTSDQMSKSYYKEITKKPNHFDLRDFNPIRLLETHRYYMNILIRTHGVEDSYRNEIDEKANILKNEILKTFAENATYNIAVYHYNKEQDYNSSAIESADETTFYFGYQGNEVSNEMVQDATNQNWLEGSVPDIKYYMLDKH